MATARERKQCQEELAAAQARIADLEAQLAGQRQATQEALCQAQDNRTRVEQSLRDSEQRYHALFNSMTEGFAIHEIITDQSGRPIDWRFLDINPAFERFTGLKRQDVVGRTHNEVLPGDDPKWLEMYGCVALTGEPVQFENYSPALKRHYQVLAYRPAPRQFAVIFMDITERKRMEEAIKTSGERYRLLAETMLHGVVHQDAAGTIIAMNPAAVRILGKTPEAFLGSSSVGEEHGTVREDGSLFPGQEHPAMVALRTGQPVRGVVMGVFNPREGRRRWIRIDAVPVRRAGETQPGEVYTVFEDITEQKQAEAALRKAHQRLQTTLDSITDGLLVLDRNWRYTYFSETGAKMLGMGREDLIGGCVWDLFPYARSTKFHEAYHRAVGTGQPVHFEEFYPEPLNKWLECHCYPSEEGLAVYFRDVTDRKRTDEALRDSERRFRQLADAMPQVVWTADADGVVDYYNAHAAEYGLAVAGLSDHDWAPDVHPDDVASTLEAWRQARMRGLTYQAELRLRMVDGRYRWHLARAVPQRDDNGVVVKWFGTTTDIHDLKQAEESLRQAHERLGYHVENSPLGVIEFDAQLRVASWSDGAARIFGWQAGEVLGKWMWDVPWIFEEDRQKVRAVSAALNDGTTLRSVSANRNLRKDGSVVWCEWHNSTLLNPQGRMSSILSLVLDVTERTQAEQQLKELNDALEKRVAERTAEANHRAEQLRALAVQLSAAEQKERARLAMLLHDGLQQILVGAKFHVGILRGQLNSPEQREMVKQVDDLLDESLDASRSLTVDLSPPILQQGNMAQVLQWLGKWFAGKHGLVVEVRAEEEADPRASEVRVLLFQAVRELLFNVVKHAGVGRACVEMDCTDQGQVRVVVSDAGEGFDPAGAGHDKKQGSGFGLLSIRERLDWLGGRLQMESAPGRGTRATVVVPMEAASPAANDPCVAPSEG